MEDHWIEAEGTLNLISREFQQGNHSIRTLAAESEALLGIIALPSFPHAGTDAAYSLASAHFQRAAEWASSPDRRALFYSLSGYARWRLQEFDEAESAYRLAVGLASPGPLQDRYGDSLRCYTTTSRTTYPQLAHLVTEKGRHSLEIDGQRRVKYFRRLVPLVSPTDHCVGRSPLLCEYSTRSHQVIGTRF